MSYFFGKAKFLVSTLTANKFIGEAAELGLAPGEWPLRPETDLGNGQHLFVRRVLSDGSHVYGQQFGCIEVMVLND
jgi:hypothetical protein